MIAEIETKNEINIELSNFQDLDIFLYDDRKLIHIATAGMKLINSLRDIDYDLLFDRKRVLAYRRKMRFESNFNIERENILEISYYKYFFELMSLRGFYSYDKVDIDDPENYNFQLISKPIYESNIRITTDKFNQIEFGNLNSSKKYNYNINFIKTKRNFPEDFQIFDISEYI